MKHNTLLFIGFLLFDVAALAWGAWELWSARADKTAIGDESAAKTMTATTPQASPDLPGHPEG